jgi:prepilin-type N-terminal cleavage/methylation domain-containing protein
MRRKRNNCSRPWAVPAAAAMARRGMTLVEVVASLALLASLLVGLLLAKARFTRQSALADRRIEAVRAADRLLTEWWADPARLPRHGAGRIDGPADLSWQTSLVANPALGELGAQVVRLEIIDDRTGATAAGGVLATVEVVLGGPRVVATPLPPNGRGG